MSTSVWDLKYEEIIKLENEELCDRIKEAFQNNDYPYFRYHRQVLKDKLNNIKKFKCLIEELEGYTNISLTGYDFFHEFFIDHFIYPVKTLTKVDDCDSLHDLYSKTPEKIYQLKTFSTIQEEFLQNYPEKYKDLKLRNGIFQDYLNINRMELNIRESSHFSILLSYTIYSYFKKHLSRNRNTFNVFDPCMGWGERLTGAGLANVSKYVGCDPNTKLFQEYPKIIHFLKKHKFSQTEYSIHNLPAEDYDHTFKYDFIFTSPPYFSKEIYSNESTQSCNKFKSMEDWENGFLIPTFMNAIKNLRRGGYLVIYMPFSLKLFRILTQNGMKRAPKIIATSVKTRKYRLMTLVKK